MADKLWCLWCIHIPGPDDLYPCPSKEAAEALAESHNRHVEQVREELQKTMPPEKFALYPPFESIKARVIEWPWSPQDHAEGLKDWEKISGAAHG